MVPWTRTRLRLAAQIPLHRRVLRALLCVLDLLQASLGSFRRVLLDREDHKDYGVVEAFQGLQS